MELKYIFFTGEGCKPCDMLKDIIKERDLYERFTVVDVGEDPELAASYHVRSLPTMFSPIK